MENRYLLSEIDNKLYDTCHFDKIFEFMRENNVQVVLLSISDGI